MKRYKVIGGLIIVMALMTACDSKSDKSIDTHENTATEIDESATTEIITSEEIKNLATLSYFENVDKNYKLEDIEKEIGNYNRTEGFGAIYYVWRLDDGSEAWVYFSGGYGKICRIHIIRNEVEELLLYNRWDEETPTDAKNI